MVGVAKDDLGADFPQLRRCDRLDRPLRPHRHENGRLHRPVTRDKPATAGGGGRIGLEQGEGPGHAVGADSGAERSMATGFGGRLADGEIRSAISAFCQETTLPP